MVALTTPEEWFYVENVPGCWQLFVRLPYKYSPRLNRQAKHCSHDDHDPKKRFFSGTAGLLNLEISTFWQSLFWRIWICAQMTFIWIALDNILVGFILVCNHGTLCTLHWNTFATARITHVFVYVKNAHAFQSRFTLSVLLFLDTCISFFKRPRIIV